VLGTSIGHAATVAGPVIRWQGNLPFRHIAGAEERTVGVHVSPTRRELLLHIIAP
jgi:hypothetical protein